MGEVGEGLRTIVGPQLGGVDLLNLLEVRIGELVERHRAARATIEELTATLVDRDRRIRDLLERVDALDRTRLEARDRLDRLIARIEAVGESEGAGAFAAEGGAAERGDP
jgi:septal ring factor EnvC (AmiA/AmiB activator)